MPLVQADKPSERLKTNGGCIIGAASTYFGALKNWGLIVPLTSS